MAEPPEATDRWLTRGDEFLAADKGYISFFILLLRELIVDFLAIVNIPRQSRGL